jgi:hypothetical protein
MADARSAEKLIYVFDKNGYTFVTGIADRGQGAGEIANMGFIGVNESGNIFDVIDHGKQKVFAYSMDSVLANPSYMPEVKMTMNKIQFPENYQYLSDTLLMGVMIKPDGNSGFNHTVAKISGNTGNITPATAYKHPGIDRKRVCFAASPEHDRYVECYHYHDLMTVYNLDGDFMYNIYGRKWDDRMTNKYGYYVKAVFCRNRIVALFADGKDRYSSTESDYPTQFLVFDTDGDYIQTLETGYPIVDFCYDRDNHRIIMHLDDEMQFARLDLTL